MDVAKETSRNNIERSRIFTNVFGISTYPDGYKPKLKQDWYEKRNAIAHGRAGVDMTLEEYIEVDAFVANAMLHLSDECLKKFRILL